jgi:hypothetical protein
MRGFSIDSRVYAAADSGSNIVATATYGQLFIVIDSSGDWRKIEYVDQGSGRRVSGWIDYASLQQDGAFLNLTVESDKMDRFLNTAYRQWLESFLPTVDDWDSNDNNSGMPPVNSTTPKSGGTRPADTAQTGGTNAAAITGSAYVISQTVTMRQKNSLSAKAIVSIPYGESIQMLRQSDGWVYGKYESYIGWVSEAYLVVNPRYFTTISDTPAYAYPSDKSPRVGLLTRNTKLAIIAEYGDYFVVSLRGASAFIKK